MKHYFTTLLVVIIVGYSQNIKSETTCEPSQDTNYYAKAQQYYIASKNDSALSMLNRGLEICDTNEHQHIAKILILRSTVLGNLTSFEKSMEDALKALSISEQHNLMGSKSSALLNIGKIHYMMYNDKQAEEFMLNAKTVAEEHNLEFELMQAAGSLGELYIVLERNNEGLSLINLALEMAREQSDTLHTVLYLRSLGDYYINLNRWTDAIVKEHQLTAKKYLDEALNLAMVKHLPMQINYVYFSMLRWCRIEKDYTKALEYASKIVEDTDPDNYSFLLQVYGQLVGVYAHLGDAQMTIQSHQQFYTIMTKQSNYNLHRSLQEMEVKYETEKKELEIEKQQSEIKRHKILQIIYIAGLIAAILIVVLLTYIIRINRKRNRDLKEINATKDKFFSIISHDLKNPAIAQRNALQLLTESSDDWDMDSLKQYYAELLKSADYQVELLYDLLNWAQVQTGRMPYRPVIFDFTETIRPEIAMIGNMADKKNIQLNVQMPDHTFITGDRNMLLTVIRNLLTNAVKFTNEHGKVSFEVVSSDKNYIISVSDTGVGMNVEQLQNLFRIDKQRSKTGTAGEQGSGLGLIVSKELIEKHGSTLHIESEEGKGSRFWFEITALQE